MNEINKENLMETATYESVSIFDQCTVVAAKLEDGTILTQAYIAESPDKFDEDYAVEMCIRSMWDMYANIQVKESQTAAPTSMTAKQAEVVIAFAENNLNVTDTAKKLGCHRNNVSYYLEKVKEQTGKDPKSFFGLCELLIEARDVLTQGE